MNDKEKSYAETTKETYHDKLFDEFGELKDPEKVPRVGDEYQVEIPPLEVEVGSHRTQNGAKWSDDVAHEVIVGLPISLMWIKEAEGGNGVTIEGHVDSTADMSKCNVENGHDHAGKGYRLVPGTAAEAWSDADEAKILLGLYIFGKNLVQVKKFIGNKTMGEMLAFYYGKFYRSNKFRRWAACRNVRSRKCIHGQRIFTGFRHQELFSRLLLNVSDECKRSVMEDTQALGDGRMSLEEYVLGLRDKFGLTALVEAVAIGKGQLDITGMYTESLRSINAASIRPDLPMGKPVSNLTTQEIIHFLTGGFRLSKGRSYELFWDAVWPRLLARGWHSEQPNDSGSTTCSRNSLIFLVPGIQKFSRRKLVKGLHYFDSISDVLSKVALEPALLELELENNAADNNVDNKVSNEWTNGTKSDQKTSPDQQKQYLKPKTATRGMKVMKFTIVDTSRAERLDIRELTSLPVELSSGSSSRSQSDEDNKGTCEESADESDSTYTEGFDQYEHQNSTTAKVNIDRGISLDRNASKKRISSIGPEPIIASAVKPSDQKNDDRKSEKTGNTQLGRKRRPESDILLAPVTKGRRTLHPYDHQMETTTGIQDTTSTGERHLEGGNADTFEQVSLEAEITQEKFSSATASSKSGLVVSDEGNHGSMDSGIGNSQDKPRPRMEIDLNLPFQPDSESDELFSVQGSENNQPSMQTDKSNAKKPVEPISTSDQQATVNTRRHSTRNRPLSTKALEAFAMDILPTNKKRKSKDAFPEPITWPSVRACGSTRATENLATGIHHPSEEGNGPCNEKELNKF